MKTLRGLVALLAIVSFTFVIGCGGAAPEAAKADDTQVEQPAPAAETPAAVEEATPEEGAAVEPGTEEETPVAEEPMTEEPAAEPDTGAEQG